MAAALLRGGTGLCFKCIHKEVYRLVWRPQTALLCSKPSDSRKQPRLTHIKKAKPKPAVDIAELLEQLFSQRRHDTAPSAGRASTRPPATSFIKTTTSTSSPSSKTKPAVSVSPETTHPCKTSPISPPPINVSVKSGPPPVPKPAVGISTKSSPSSKITSQPPLPFIVSDMTTQAPSIELPPAETIEAKVETSIGSGELTAAPVPLTVETLEFTAATVEPLVETVAAPISDPACTTFPVENTIEPTVDTRPSPLETLEAASVKGTVEPTVEAAVDTATQAVETKATDSGADVLSQTALIKKITIESIAISVETKAETTVESSILSSGTVVGRGEERKAKEEDRAEEEVAGEDVSTVPEAMTPESVTPAEVKALVEVLPTDALLQTKSTLDDKAEKNLTEILSERDSPSEAVEALQAETDNLMEELLCSAPEAVSRKPGSPLHTTAPGPPMGARRHAVWRVEEEEVIAEKLIGQEAVRESAIGGEERAEEGGRVLEAMTLESVTLAEVEAVVATLENVALTETTAQLEKEAEMLSREARMGEERTVREDGSEEKTEEEEALSVESLSLPDADCLSEALQAETDLLMEELLFSAPGHVVAVTKDVIGQEVVREGILDGKVDGEEKGGEEIVVNEAQTSESLSEVEALVETLEMETETKTQLKTEAKIPAKETQVQQEAFSEVDISSEVENFSEADVLVEAADASDAELAVTLQNPLRPVAAGSASTDSATTTPHPAAPSALNEVTGQEEKGTGSPPAAPAGRRQEAETEGGAGSEALGIYGGLDPVQRLFLEKIREYNNKRRSCGGAVEAGPDYEKRLSEEKAKLQRLYGGGDLSSFPQFTFTEPKLDQD